MEFIDVLNKTAGMMNQPCKVITKEGKEYQGILSATRYDDFGGIVLVLSNKMEKRLFANTEIIDLSFI